MSPLLVACAVALVAGNAPVLLFALAGFLSRRSFTIGASLILISWAFGIGVAIIASAKGWV